MDAPAVSAGAIVSNFDEEFANDKQHISEAGTSDFSNTCAIHARMPKVVLAPAWWVVCIAVFVCGHNQYRCGTEPLRHLHRAFGRPFSSGLFLGPLSCVIIPSEVAEKYTDLYRMLISPLVHSRNWMKP